MVVHFVANCKIDVSGLKTADVLKKLVLCDSDIPPLKRSKCQDDLHACPSQVVPVFTTLLNVFRSSQKSSLVSVRDK